MLDGSYLRGGSIMDLFGEVESSEGVAIAIHDEMVEISCGIVGFVVNVCCFRRR